MGATRALWATCVCLLITPGCGDSGHVRFSDSIDVTFDLLPGEPPGDALHQPYAQGAEFRVTAASRLWREDVSDWEIESTDAEVLLIESEDIDEDSVSVEVRARGDGACRLEVFDADGLLIGATDIEVVMPDSAAVTPHGALLVAEAAVAEDTTTFQVLTGGEATFLVQWYEGPRQLYGHGVLGVEHDGGLSADAEQSFLMEDRDWLQVRPEEVGEAAVRLLAAGQHVDEVTILAVDSEHVAAVQLHGQDERGAARGETLELLAQAYDEDERPVYGVAFGWEIDGLIDHDTGDLYTYRYDPTLEELVQATFDGLSDAALVHGEGEVGSTNSTGCQVGGGGPAGLRAALTLLALVAFCRRR